MKLRRELSDLPFAGALTPHEGDLAAEGHYDGSHFTGRTTYTGARADGGRFMECAFFRGHAGERDGPPEPVQRRVAP